MRALIDDRVKGVSDKKMPTRRIRSVFPDARLCTRSRRRSATLSFSLRFSAYLCDLCVKRALQTQRSQRYAEVRREIFDFLCKALTRYQSSSRNTAGGSVNHDTHGDSPGGATHSFTRGRGVESDSGELTAPFDGNHGWFRRNRSGSDVTVTLKVTGEYRSVKRVA